MKKQTRILYCHCAYSDVVPAALKTAVFEALDASGAPFEAVADLCGMAAGADPALKDFADAGAVKIAACYPRAVRWLFAAAGAPLDNDAQIFNMRCQDTDQIVRSLLDGRDDADAAAPGKTPPPRAEDDDWIPWFPVIDYDLCKGCKQCLNFCLFGAYALDDGRVVVANPRSCKTNCPACARLCPAGAIIFPKYHSEPINGAEVSAEDLAERGEQDIAAVLKGDVYSVLRARGGPPEDSAALGKELRKALTERRQRQAPPKTSKG